MAKWYPKEVYSIREDVTRENMRQYDLRQERILNAVLRIAPDYYSLPWRERIAIRKRAEALVK